MALQFESQQTNRYKQWLYEKRRTAAALSKGSAEGREALEARATAGRLAREEKARLEQERLDREAALLEDAPEETNEGPQTAISASPAPPLPTASAPPASTTRIRRTAQPAQRIPTAPLSSTPSSPSSTGSQQSAAGSQTISRSQPISRRRPLGKLKLPSFARSQKATRRSTNRISLSPVRSATLNLLQS